VNGHCRTNDRNARHARLVWARRGCQARRPLRPGRQDDQDARERNWRQQAATVRRMDYGRDGNGPQNGQGQTSGPGPRIEVPQGQEHPHTGQAAQGMGDNGQGGPQAVWPARDSR
jgi:hypothetical protein